MANIGPTLSKSVGASELSNLLESDKAGIYFAKTYLALDGITDDYSALYALINTTINGDDAEIWFKDGTCLIGTSITMPSNVKLKFLNSGILKPASGVTVTGSNAKIEAGIYQIFDTSAGGTIAGTWDKTEAYPQWFGAVGDGATDDSSAINSVITFCEDGDRVVMPYSTSGYYILSTINVTKRIILTGAGRKTRVKAGVGCTTMIKLSNVKDIEICYLKLNGDGEASYGFEIRNTCNNIKIHNNEIFSIADTCILVGSTYGIDIRDNWLHDNSGATGIQLRILDTFGVYSSTIQKNIIESCSVGIKLGNSGSTYEVEVCSIKNNILQSITSRAIEVRRTFNVDVETNWFELNGTSSGYDINATNEQLTNFSISNNFFKSPDSVYNINITASGSAGVELSRNLFNGNGSTEIVIGSSVVDVIYNQNVTQYAANIASAVIVKRFPQLEGSLVWDPGSLSDGVGETSSNITVDGAIIGNAVDVIPPYDTQGIICYGYVSASNVVNIRIQNETGSTIDLASGTWKARIR